MKYTIYETFVGAGGSHLGFKQNGFVSKYVNDLNPECLKTLTFNNPDIAETAYVDSSNILDLDPEFILKKTNMNPEELDVLFGGIVCKGFSMAGERKPNDERNYFYHKQLDLARVIRPKFSIIENVPGISNATVLSRHTPKELSDKIDVLWKSIENYKGVKSSLRKSGNLTEDFEAQGKELRIEKEKILSFLKDNKYLISVMEDRENLYNDIDYRV